MHIEEHHHTSHHYGARISTPELRHSLKLSEYFDGLEKDVQRYDLLVLVKRAGKAAGFTPRLIQLLDYYMAFTRDSDWEEGRNPIVYQSVSKTAMELGVTERQVRRMEHQLFELGALTWCDSGNHRRYGYRDPDTGELIYAFGVDLTPLASLSGKLQAVIDEKTAHTQEWQRVKRHISWMRAQIRSVLASMAEQGSADEILAAQSRFKAISEPLRSSMALCRLNSLCYAHQALLADILPADNAVDDLNETEASVQKESAMEDKNDRHIENTNQKQFSKENSSPPDKAFRGSKRQGQGTSPDKSNCNESFQQNQTTTPEDIILSTGLQHITLKQALNASGERFRSRIPLEPRPMNWADFAAAAHKRRRELKISQSLWATACELLGRNGAAVMLIIVDRATEREDNPVRSPGAYFRAMLARARTGNLNLQASIFAWLKREEW